MASGGGGACVFLIIFHLSMIIYSYRYWTYSRVQSTKSTKENQNFLMPFYLSLRKKHSVSRFGIMCKDPVV